MPVTRSANSGLSSTAGASAHPSDTPLVKGESLTEPTLSVLEDLEDDTLLRGRDAKVLRDATTSAITQVWNDTCATAALLTRQINEGNAALTEKLNESFASVGKRLDGLPAVAMLQPESPMARITPFSGASENGVQFSIWLRRLEDVMRMRPVALTDEQRANFLIGHLEGVAREKVEELDESAKRVYASVVSHLVAFFESPQQRYVARQKLSACRQEPGKPCTSFANRILNLVRAATSGQDPTTQKERVLEEFVARLRGDIRYFVKLDSPSSFEQAVTKAQTVEQLLSEATADRLLHPTTTLAPVQVLARPSNRGETQHQPAAPKRAQPRPRMGQQRPSPSRRAPSPQVLRPASEEARCFNCNGLGHFANICPSARRPRVPGPRPTPRGFPSAPFPREASYNHGGPPASAQANVLSCTSSRQPAHSITHNADSRDCIAELTASLKDTQVQLENSQARVAALLHRNMELTQDPQDHVPSPPSAMRSHTAGSSSLPDVRLLFCLLLTVTCFLSPGLAFDAWLCPSDGPTTLFFLRDHQNCSRLLPNPLTQPHRISLHLYRPNTQLYSSPASLCKIIRHSVTYSVSFFGARRERHTETHMTVSTEECRQMILHHRCPHGHMVEESGVWRTQNSLSFVFPSAPFGCCVDHSMTVTNCYSYSTTVHTRHADKAPQTSAGDTSACSYKDGSCTLSDGSVLLWSPIQEEQCGYALVAKLTGSMMGPIWLSDDKEFALSWNEHSRVISDCTKELTVTDQGYAIQISRRHSRSSSGDVGVVTSNQLSAQLLAVEGATYSSISALFRNALRSLCERTNSMGSAVHTALRSHPTATMRTLLGRNDIAASYLGSGYVEVRRCMAVPSSALRVVPFNNTCYEFPHVELRLPSGSRFRAFLDPTTGIVRKLATTVDCADAHAFVFPTPNGAKKFSPRDGVWTVISAAEAKTIPTHSYSIPMQLSPPLTVFHNLVLTNFSELTGDRQLQELWVTRSHERILEHFSHVDSTESSSYSPSPNTQVSPFPFSLPFSTFDIWVFCCCVLVSLSFVKELLIIYVKLYSPTWANRIPGLPPLTVDTPPAPMATSTPRPLLPLAPAAPLAQGHPLQLNISQIEIDAATAWPPRASMVPTEVLSLDTLQPYFVAQIPIRANGVYMLALVDTGAGVTVASQAMLPLLGIFHLQPCQVSAAVGMAGVPVKFVGSATVAIQLGKHALDHVVHFTESNCIPRAADAYNIILGNDLLQRLPLWALNYSQRTLLVGGEPIPILTPSPGSPPRQDPQPLSVHVATTTVLPPASEVFVPCYVAGIDSKWSTMVVDGSVLAQDHVMVAPAVSQVNAPRLFFSNPTDTPKVLYKGQYVTSARPVFELPNGSIVESCF